MEIENDKIILTISEDYELIRLIHHIKKLGYGELIIKIKESKPHRIIKSVEDILLTKDSLGNSKK